MGSVAFRVHEYERLPRLMNPESGQIALMAFRYSSQ